MKRILPQICSILLLFSLTACGVGEAQPPATTPSVPSPPITQDAEVPTDEPTGELLQLTTEQGEAILFALNNSNAAKSLYEQLPLSLEIEDYSNNEKIFYPPEKLDTSDTPMAQGPVGTLAYYAPWGDVAIYYGDCGGVSGLYQLGQVVSGTEHISEMSGVIQIEAVGSNAPSAEPTFPESATTSKEPSATLEASSTETATTSPAAPKPPVQAAAPEQDDNATPPSAQEETQPKPTPPEDTPESTVPEEDIMRSIQITVQNKTFSATLEENDAAKSFAQMLQSAPVVIQMSDYSGFEKVGSLGISLHESNRHITAQSGDIILYNGNQIVVFYGSNSWSYTKLGRIDDLSGWEEALGNGDVTLTFSIQ